jgi:hypothetical protein
VSLPTGDPAAAASPAAPLGPADAAAPRRRAPRAAVFVNLP